MSFRCIELCLWLYEHMHSYLLQVGLQIRAKLYSLEFFSLNCLCDICVFCVTFVQNRTWNCIWWMKKTTRWKKVSIILVVIVNNFGRDLIHYHRLPIQSLNFRNIDQLQEVRLNNRIGKILLLIYYHLLPIQSLNFRKIIILEWQLKFIGQNRILNYYHLFVVQSLNFHEKSIYWNKRKLKDSYGYDRIMK